MYFQLGVMNLDLAVVADKPTDVTEASSDDDWSIHTTWERSNRLALNLMKMTMVENVKPSMPKTDNAKQFMAEIKEYSYSEIADKSIVGSLMSELTTKEFEWSQPIHEHVTSMQNLAAKLKAMGMDVSETFLVQFIINSLPTEFGQFQVNYNTLKEKWNIQEIKAMLVQEEGRLKKMKEHMANLTFHPGSSSSNGKFDKDMKKVKGKGKFHGKGKIKKEIKCYFCKEIYHLKKECPKRKAWFKKKGIPFDPNHKQNQ